MTLLHVLSDNPGCELRPLSDVTYLHCKVVLNGFVINHNVHDITHQEEFSIFNFLEAHLWTPLESSDQHQIILRVVDKSKLKIKKLGKVSANLPLPISTRVNKFLKRPYDILSNTTIYQH